MPEFIYTMTKARKAVGDKVILDDVTMSFFPGAKIGVVGPNGAGKSTMLKIMAGLDQPSNGEARIAPGATVGILLQEPPLNEEQDRPRQRRGGRRRDQGEARPLQRDLRARWPSPDADYDALLAEMGKLQEEIDHADAWDLDAQLEQAMDALRCPPPDADVTILSGGERRRVALCKLLLQKPDLLLLDEPTNHLDAESVQWLEQHLAAYPGAVLAVTHDRYFLDNVAQWILELDRGRLTPTRATTRPTSRRRRTASRSRARRTPSGPRGSSDELEWVRSNAKGRQAKSQGPAAALRGDGGGGRPHPQARLRGDPDPAGPAAGRRRSSRSTTSTRASTTGCSSTTCPSRCRATASSA